VPRKGRARRFREARELKQGYDDGLFKESEKSSLADVWDPDAEPSAVTSDETDDDSDDWDDEVDPDEYDPLDH
jgi:hypothetical protein